MRSAWGSCLVPASFCFVDHCDIDPHCMQQPPTSVRSSYLTAMILLGRDMVARRGPIGPAAYMCQRQVKTAQGSRSCSEKGKPSKAPGSRGGRRGGWRRRLRVGGRTRWQGGSGGWGGSRHHRSRSSLCVRLQVCTCHMAGVRAQLHALDSSRSPDEACGSACRCSLMKAWRRKKAVDIAAGQQVPWAS